MAKVPVSPVKNATVAKVAAKPATKTATKGAFVTEVKSDRMPSYIYGDVAYSKDNKGYRIRVRRRQSSKVDTYIVPETDVMLAAEGEKGYILTDSPVFDKYVYPINLSLTNAEITAKSIVGTDPDGNDVFINRDNIKVHARQVSLAE